MMRSTKNPQSGAIPIGVDGAAMLALSGLIVVATGGLSWLALIGRVAWVGWRAPSAPKPERVVVLGRRLGRDGAPDALYRCRLARAEAVLAAGASVAFLLGGVTRAGAMSEAAAGAAFLRARGVAASRLRLEDGSSHTLENLRFYRDRFADGDTSRAAALVTNRFHLARAGTMAAFMGIAHTLCAAEASPAAVLRHPLRLLQESALLHWYLVGRGFARLTGNRRMTARIS